VQVVLPARKANQSGEEGKHAFIRKTIRGCMYFRAKS
jgi:hypothetical protein